jgi:outer membrane protein OmpA-like peptidoglycan-associated protein/thiol-disulfide isomerase/thioredoxin
MQTMKQIVLNGASAVILSFMGGYVSADPIEFRDLTVAEALDKAREENKFLLIDVYTDWCRPCKQMETEIFANDSIGDFINQNYIAIRIDADREEGQFLEEQEITAYPTLLFYEPQGRQVARKVGAVSPAFFYDMVLNLMKVQSYYRVYQESPEKPEVVYHYLHALSYINEEQANRMAGRYLQELDRDDYAQLYNWKLIKEFMNPRAVAPFERAFTSQELAEKYDVAYEAFIRHSLEELFQAALQYKKEGILRTFKNYVRRSPDLYSNPDSVMQVADVIYSYQHRHDQLARKLGKYIEDHEEKTAAVYLDWAIFILEGGFFRKELTAMGISLAEQSLELQKTFEAYLALSEFHRESMDFSKAFAYLLLAEEFAETDEETALLFQKKKAVESLALLDNSDGVTVAGSKGMEDGRFTLGAGDQRLMYGFPVPKSTSHFIVNIDGKLASNSPVFGDKMGYLKGELLYSGEAATPLVTCTYSFENVEITQQLIPVDKDGLEVQSGLAQYYKVQYRFRSLDGIPRRIGLGLLFDTMIDDNDACEIAVDGKVLTSEWGFLREHMPTELKFYRTPGDSTDMMGAAILQGMGATTPDKLVIGRWPVLHNVEWELHPMRVPYGDSAFFLKWENRILQADAPMQFVTYYGLPAHKEPELSILLEDKSNKTLTENIYFAHESSGLDLNAKMQLDELLSRDDIVITGAILNGYTDAKGGDDYNFTLSEKRIAAVGKILRAHGVSYTPKPYGISEDNVGAYDAQVGNAWNRRVEVIIYYRTKGSDVERLLSAR